MAARRRTSRTKKRSSKRRTSRARRRVRKRKVTKKRRTTRKRKVTKRKRTKRKKVVKRRRARKKVSIRGTRAQVFRGTRQKVKTTGQKKDDLMKNKRGKVISKAAHKHGKKVYKKNGIEKWNKAFMQARKNLGITGFQAIKKGSALYQETMKL